MVMTDSSDPQAASDSDDLASVIDPEEESLIPLGSDEAEGNGMVPVLNISSDVTVADNRHLGTESPVGPG